jgi:hypothetical protein
MQEKIYQLTGKTLEVTPDQMNGLIENDDVHEKAHNLIRLLLDK